MTGLNRCGAEGTECSKELFHCRRCKAEFCESCVRRASELRVQSAWAQAMGNNPGCFSYLKLMANLLMAGAFHPYGLCPTCGENGWLQPAEAAKSESFRFLTNFFVSR